MMDSAFWDPSVLGDTPKGSTCEGQWPCLDSEVCQQLCSHILSSESAFGVSDQCIAPDELGSYFTCEFLLVGMSKSDGSCHVGPRWANVKSRKWVYEVILPKGQSRQRQSREHAIKLCSFPHQCCESPCTLLSKWSARKSVPWSGCTVRRVEGGDEDCSTIMSGNKQSSCSGHSSVRGKDRVTLSACSGIL